jgi:tetratricopeptide (TPR) repeat protein
MTRFRVLFVGALAAALALAVACPVAACVNPIAAVNLQDVIRKGDPTEIARVVGALEKAHAAKPTLENSNDLGVARLLTGKLDESIALFRETDRMFPGNARVAANLGTALQLKGDNEEALTWIREGIKRDANEHKGSEWLHARILEAGIALAKDPAWIEKNRVLELDFGKDEVPTAPEILPIENGRIKGAAQLIEQIGYQLDERTKFVKPPDPITGDLYASEGDLAIAGALSPLDDRKSGLTPDVYYEQALNYGAPHADLIRRRLAKYRADLAALPPAPKEAVADYPVVKNRFDKPPVKSNTIWIYVGVAASLMAVLVIIGMLLDRRRRRREEATPTAPLPDIE